MIISKVVEDVMVQVRRDFIKEKKSRSTDMNAAEVSDSYASKFNYYSSQQSLDKSRGASSRRFGRSKFDQSSEHTESKRKYESQSRMGKNLLLNNAKAQNLHPRARSRQKRDIKRNFLEHTEDQEQYSSDERDIKNYNKSSNDFVIKRDTDAFSPNLDKTEQRDELTQFDSVNNQEISVKKSRKIVRRIKPISGHRKTRSISGINFQSNIFSQEIGGDDAEYADHDYIEEVPEPKQTNRTNKLQDDENKKKADAKSK